MFTGRFPFKGKTDVQTAKKVIHTRLKFKSWEKKVMPKCLRKWLKRMFRKDYKKRLTAAEALN